MEAYSKFDFEGNDNFQKYLLNVYPLPPNLDKIKRKWYKTYIDPEFDINIESQNSNQNTSQQTTQNEKPQKQETHQQPQQSQQQQQQQQNYENRQQLPSIPIWTIIEGMLKVIYFPALLFLLSPQLHKYLNFGSIFICLLAIYRLQGLPKKNYFKEYIIKIIQLEFTSNIFFIISLFTIDSFAFQLPIALHFMVGAAEFWTKINHEQGISLKVAKYITTESNRSEIILTKQKIEIYLFLYSVVGIFIKKTSFVQAIIIFQNVLLKTKFNKNMKNAQAYIRVWYADKLSENRILPEGLRKIFSIIWKGYEKLLTLF
ncbi:unnamed protein product (macronuclear) [Paramecium tetraurelia]|uniref:Uncharacterized protein n=1 Tax=Paramecium tetraurelia TaxID=5888 RepID=A0CW46_PARTE|nr:uncharacterized protein GSPATT00001215001 [Paramecium tetraurelia]CAK75013.1 unnamed protein product [Paramecium tetraurelia]|eukprot:XP_001442410.1 hypothetical protein (macronuclear) [Paramecium tetraurelia strain d4-2]